MIYGEHILGSELSGLQKLNIRVHFNGEDKTQYISIDGFEIEKNITNQVDMARFSIIGNEYTPSILDEVEIYRDTTPETNKLFGGHIIDIEKTINGLVPITYITCSDYTYKMNSKLVAKEYEDTTVENIITDIISNYAPADYTTNGVSADIPVARMKFNYQEVSKCIQELAELYGYDWYVDEFKDIKFFPKLSEDAPFNLDDTSGNYEFGSLMIRESVDDLKNAIFVRGGELVSDTTTTENLDTQVDGTNDIFKVGYRYKNYTLAFNGTPLSVGIENLNTFSDVENYDALYNFQEKTITFRTAPQEANKPITFSGNIYIPISVFRKDSNSVTDYGQEFQFRITDKQIVDSGTALMRARAELDNFARSLRSGQFVTKTDGLRAGQKINIQSDIRGLDNDYIISRVLMQTHTPFDFRYTVDIMTTKTNNFVDLMQKLLLDKNKNIDIDANERQIIEFFEELDPQISIWDTTFDTTTPWGIDADIRWVAGSPYTPVNSADLKRTPKAQEGGPQAKTYV